MSREVTSEKEPFNVQKIALTPDWAVDVGDYVTSLSYSPDGSVIAGTQSDGGVFWVEDKGQDSVCIATHKHGALSSSWSSDGKYLASGGQDGKIVIWSTESGKPSATMEGGSAWVEHLAWHPSKPILATASGKYLRLFDAEGKLIREVNDFKSTISGLSWHERLDTLGVVCYGNVRFLRLEVEKPWKNYELTSSLLSLHWAPDGKHIACACQDNSVHIWILALDEDLEMSGYRVKVRDLAWDSSSRFLATAGGDRLTIWDFSGKGPAGSRPKELNGHTDIVTSLAFQPNGQVLASAAQDGSLLFWNPFSKSKMPLGLGVREANPSKLSWHPNGRQLVAGYNNGHIIGWPCPS